MLNTYAYKLWIRIGLTALMFFVVACSEKGADVPGYNAVHTETWGNPKYVNEALFHGTEVKRKGAASCRKCHEIYGKGQKQIPGCFKCHFGPEGSRMPTGSDWAHGFTRHEEFQNDQAVCNACHDVGRSSGTGPGICHNCHGSGDTHMLGQPWLDRNSAEFHGTTPQDECASCHDLASDCNLCHFGANGSKAPVGSAWEHGNNDDHKDYESQVDTCNTCHTLNRSYGSEPAACHDCHGLENHVLGQEWLDRGSVQFHGTASQTNCSTCHDLAQECIQCHFGQTGSRSPIGSGWSHGVIDGHNDRKNSIDVCNQCHDLSRSYRNEPVSCHDCHED